MMMRPSTGRWALLALAVAASTAACNGDGGDTDNEGGADGSGGSEEDGTGGASDGTGGTSDGRFISRICPQVIEFGPLNASIHKIDEHVRVADLEPLKDIYRGVLEHLDRP